MSKEFRTSVGGQALMEGIMMPAIFRKRNIWKPLLR